MNRFICIHGHFYQPPRENPWLETIEIQDEAAPFHDWNERIDSEAYAPNGASRMLDDTGRIREIVNNYRSISFNFGPTLLSWMEKHAPETYRRVLDADRASRERFSGHGNALAQVYHHLIMPLANRRDKETQIHWGVRDFERRFGRRPEGMWLAETAVDGETLELLAEAGIQYTLLAPNQAARVRAPGGDWVDVSDSSIDTTRAYRQKLPSGKTIALFFYDGPTARAVAFEGLLHQGDHLARRLLGSFTGKNPEELVHIATDGETYGHHHRFGDMALAEAIRLIEAQDNVVLTNYGEFLERFGAEHEVEIVENTSWSCAHGVERWRSDCGCSTGGEPGWNQRWRAPLRRSLDELRDRFARRFETATDVLRDPWAARDEYIETLTENREQLKGFLERHLTPGLDAEGRSRALKLLELQRHAMLMYTSCGWFFNDVSRIETIQVLRYAARAVQLAEALFEEPFEETFLEHLEECRSNEPGEGSGRDIYLKQVRPAKVDLRRVAAHIAVRLPFQEEIPIPEICCYDVEMRIDSDDRSGTDRLMTGTIGVTARITEESGRFVFALIHRGQQNVSAGVVPETEVSEEMQETVRKAFQKTGAGESIIAEACGELHSLRSLFRDDRRAILETILESGVREAEDVYRLLYERNSDLIRYLTTVRYPQPEVFRFATQVFLGRSLRTALEDPRLPVETIRGLVTAASETGMDLERDSHGYRFQRTLERAFEALVVEPPAAAALERLEQAIRLVDDLPFRVSLWRVRNLFFGIWKDAKAISSKGIESSVDPARTERLTRLAATLTFLVD